MRFAALMLAAALATAAGPGGQPAAGAPAPPIDLFFAAAGSDERKARPALDEIARGWRDSYAAMIIDLARLMRAAPRDAGSDQTPGLAADDATDFAGSRGGDTLDRAAAPIRRESIARRRLISFLERQTKQRFGDNLNAWREWMWTLPAAPHPDYMRFKGAVYAQIDPRMAGFFRPDATSLIRLDEIDWGGVQVNGIPPLYYPKQLSATDAPYLRDSHIVFGVVINGEARAYPKRILAWHEMAIDRIGGVEMTIVYCTLCGTVIPYESRAGGQVRRFGTSGLLYRSNKLMFDEETLSLWSTLEGRPVVGPLAGSDLQLTMHGVVTTTWGEWRAEHPTTTVLSLDTGHKRDYGEGAAYREYFSTDDLYFRVSNTDTRLKKKDEVLALQVAPAGGGEPAAVAIAAALLKKNQVYHFEIGGRRFVALTTAQGANRVFDAGSSNVRFVRLLGEHLVLDAEGEQWRWSEQALTRANDETARLPRVPAHRAFWFGWYAQFPDTALIK
ncbi:MAG TPA: DUF3179 domain-containing protein [Vicinamibacterales bacterium]|nr:DUF3179 domain-containing protein [Vicinamibacterales bacterium]